MTRPNQITGANTGGSRQLAMPTRWVRGLGHSTPLSLVTPEQPDCPSDMHRNNRGAFTLVELLVVIAVIGILAAILLSVLAKAKARGRAAACQNNLRQVGLLMAAYVQEHGHYPERKPHAVWTWLGFGDTMNRSMIMLSMTPRDRKILAWILLVMGALMTLGGLFGVWLQGAFYRGGFPTAATFGEVRSAFTWPTAFTAFGCLTVAGVLFTGSITASWSSRRRMVVFVVFGGFVLLVCGVCGHLATVRVAGILN